MDQELVKTDQDEKLKLQFVIQKDGELVPIDNANEIFSSLIKSILLSSASRDPLIKKGERHGLIEVEFALKNFTIVHEIVDPSAIKLTKTESKKIERGSLQIEDVPIERWKKEELASYPSYKRAKEAKLEVLWNSLEQMSIKQEIEKWLKEISNPRTRRSYTSAMNELVRHGFISLEWSVQLFSLLSPDLIADKIKVAEIVDEKGSSWSVATREARIACFISFTRYLSRNTEGIVRRAIPCRDGIAKTFGNAKRKKVTTPSLSRKQLAEFLSEIDKINNRDGLIARLLVHGGKRINEVLNLQTDQIDYENYQIKFHQSKSKHADDFTIVSYAFNGAQNALECLKEYIGPRKGHVFVTSHGKRICQNQIDRNFALAGKRANLPFRMSPHVLRATFITLAKQDGFGDSEIMKATGHASSEMVNKYDKSDIADNCTKRISLI